MSHTIEMKKILNSEIELLDKLLFKPLGLELKKIEKESESQNYNACTFQLNNQKIIFRTAKITPTKIGQFVAVWKRAEFGITAPYDILDDFDYFIITTSREKAFGIFLFPKTVLIENKIVSDGNKNGKRGIRVYPPWNLTINIQAQKTQLWQNEYFLDLSENTQVDKRKASILLGIKAN